MNKYTWAYNNSQSPSERKIYNTLVEEIDRHLIDAENKICHAHPTWFLESNPVAEYSKL